MSAPLLVLLGAILFAGAYLSYGGYVARRLGIDPTRPTPAQTMNDGVDYVPTRAPVVLGHHFASIAGAGPIVGPVMASIFGWLPVYLWIVVGGIFVGAVHDFSAVVASLRHRGKSIGEVIEEHIGRNGKILFLLFSWSTLLLVIAVFTQLVATTFERVPSAATASLLFMVLAVAFGWAIYRRGMPLLGATLVGVILLFLCVYAGYRWPLLLSAQMWRYLLLLYCFGAAVLPVWFLLQPRDYLNSFVLYALLAGGALGIFFAHPKVQLAAVTTFHTDLGFLFPVLFVTVACGAISGFHSLVASGTTAKQVAKESDAKPIGYGAMLIESVLAIVALMAAATMAPGRFRQLYGAQSFVPIFAEGVGGFMARIPLLGIKADLATTFAALGVSAFVLTSLDTSTRLARFAFQELFERRTRKGSSSWLANRYVGTAITILVAWVFLVSGGSQAIWPVFGSANQLLAALALLAVSVWLAKGGMRTHFVRYPMIFMFLVTLTALASLIHKNFVRGNYLLVGIGAILFALAGLLVAQAVRSLRSVKGQQA
ncbi:MAG: carbon starvation protein A [candidate division KSB1 bacterium]|nr:carbon starvation protein A [candidate division KSB1 bacterium]MDZ7412882.1 carbon starvation protein A [candidate division KSB1 bacterium]